MYEFTSSGILCTNHINCRDQLCVNLDTGELIHFGCGNASFVLSYDVLS